jgi:hypothetical protein
VLAGQIERAQHLLAAADVGGRRLAPLTGGKA